MQIVTETIKHWQEEKTYSDMITNATLCLVPGNNDGSLAGFITLTGRLIDSVAH